MNEILNPQQLRLDVEAERIGQLRRIRQKLDHNRPTSSDPGDEQDYVIRKSQAK